MFHRGFSWENIGIDKTKCDYNELNEMPSLFEEQFWRAFRTQHSSTLKNGNVKSLCVKSIVEGVKSLCMELGVK